MGKLARTLLVDKTYFQPQLVEDFCESLRNVFSVVCNAGGPSRLPLFSLFVMTTYPEMLLPLSYVKNNFGRLQTAVDDLQSIMVDTSRYHTSDRNCITETLREACNQFYRQAQGTMQQSGGLCSQLEVIIVTCQKQVIVQRQIEESSASLNLERLKRIQIVTLFGIGSDFLTEELTEDPTSQNSSVSSNSSVSGLVDIVQLDTDPLCLQNFFNSWLLDTGTDSEHLHIILPPADIGSTALVIKCDLHERILNPAQLPYFSQYTLHPDSSTMKTFPTTSKAMGMVIPVFKILINCLMPAKELCDSIVFGMPMVAQPTACWKIDWDELEKNQQVFRSLCHSLLIKNQVMIGQLESTEASTKRRHGQPEDKPHGHFVFLPAENGSFLVKSLAVQELMLPLNAGTGLETQADETMNFINSSIAKLEVIDTFNPLLWTSRLYDCLKSKYKKTDPKQSKKRYETPNSERFVSGKPLYPEITGKKSYQPVVPMDRDIGSKSVNPTKRRPLLPFPTDL